MIFRVRGHCLLTTSTYGENHRESLPKLSKRVFCRPTRLLDYFLKVVIQVLDFIVPELLSLLRVEEMYFP